MKIAKVKFIVKDDFTEGDCMGCPLGSYISPTGNTVCALNYRSCDCPIQLDDYSYVMDEDDITD